MGCLLLKAIEREFPDRPTELLKAIAVYAEIPHSRVGRSLVFPGDVRPLFERALADFDRRAERLRAMTPVAVGA